MVVLISWIILFWRGTQMEKFLSKKVKIFLFLMFLLDFFIHCISFINMKYLDIGWSYIFDQPMIGEIINIFLRTTVYI
jgi:hypothetical protein